MSPLPQWGSGNLALRLSGGKPESLPLPPVNREAQALARLAQTMAELRDEMHMMRRDMTALGTRMKASEANALVRVENASSHKDEDFILPLHSIFTGNPIKGFPMTIGDLLLLGGPRTDAILEALGLSTSGPLPERRRRLRFAAGIFKVAANPPIRPRHMGHWG